MGGKVLKPIIILTSLCVACLLPVELVKAGTNEAVAYIRSRQVADGGFCEPDRSDVGQDVTTAWCIMALAAAGLDVKRITAGGRSPLEFLATQSGNWRSVTDYERTLLAVVAGGGNPYSFGGVDLVSKVRSFQKPGGNIGDAVNSNAFGILAYKAAGLEIPPGALQWQRMVQNPDGGWGNSPGAASNPDMTAASIMALRAGGASAADPAIAAALSYLRGTQNPDGGFSFQPPYSDAAATAWCVQALVAVGQDVTGGAWTKNGNTPWGFLLSLQAPDGHFFWMQGRDMNPLWVTAYATCALARKPFPVAAYAGAQSQAESGEISSNPGTQGESAAGPAASRAPSASSSAQEQTENTGTEEWVAEEMEVPPSDGMHASAEEALGERGEEARGGFAWVLWSCALLFLAAIAFLGAWIYWRRYRSPGITSEGAAGNPGRQGKL